MTIAPTTPNTLHELVTQAVHDNVTPERVGEAVRKHVDQLITAEIRDALSSYSETGKVIRAAIRDSLRVQSLDLPAYGAVVAAQIEDLVEERVAEVVAGKLKEDIEKILHLAPKTVKLSEIVESMFPDDQETWRSEVSCSLGDPGTSGYRWLKLHPSKLESYQTPNINVLIDETGRVCGGHLGSGPIEKDSRRLGFTHGLQARFRAFYACGTIIELDEDMVETVRTLD